MRGYIAAALGVALVVGVGGLYAYSPIRRPSVKTLPPVVVKTVPISGDTRVDADDVTEVRVTFSKAMADGSWSWSDIGPDTKLPVTGKIRYDNDRRTCIAPVRLEPGRTYVTWLNSERYHNFRDKDGRPAVPYLLVFETKPLD